MLFCRHFPLPLKNHNRQYSSKLALGYHPTFQELHSEHSHSLDMYLKSCMKIEEGGNKSISFDLKSNREHKGNVVIETMSPSFLPL